MHKKRNVFPPLMLLVIRIVLAGTLLMLAAPFFLGVISGPLILGLAVVFAVLIGISTLCGRFEGEEL